MRFSTLLSSCRSSDALSSSEYPVRSSTASASAAIGPAAASSRNEEISALKSAIDLAERVARSATSSTRASAAASGIRSRWACRSTLSTARSPMPRLGTFRIRRSESSSAGFAISRR